MLKSIELIGDAKGGERKSKAGNMFQATEVQGVCHFDDGRREVFVALLFPPRGEKAKDYKAGHYLPVLEPKVDLRERKLTAEISELRPMPLHAVAPARAGS